MGDSSESLAAGPVAAPPAYRIAGGIIRESLSGSLTRAQARAQWPDTADPDLAVARFALDAWFDAPRDWDGAARFEADAEMRRMADSLVSGTGFLPESARRRSRTALSISDHMTGLIIIGAAVLLLGLVFSIVWQSVVK